MPARPLRIEFTLEADGWEPWPGTATEVEILLAALPTTTVVAPAGPRDPGLTPGERALTAAATARLLGCRSLTAAEGRRSVTGLKRQREVQVLLEEGLPSPLTGRLGAIITAAAAVARTPEGIGRAEVWRLEAEKLDDQEIVDLILTAAVASWTGRVTLGLGRPTKG